QPGSFAQYSIQDASRSAAGDDRADTGASLLRRNAADGELAGARVSLHVEAHLLTFVQACEAGALQRGGVNEHVLAAVVRRDESVTLAAVVKLHCTSRHNRPFTDVCTSGGAGLRLTPGSSNLVRV